MQTHRPRPTHLGRLAVAATLLLVATVGPARAGLVGITEGLNSSVLWDINPLTGVPTNPRTVNVTPDRAVTTIAVAPAGKLWGVSQGEPTDGPSSGHLYLIDPVTGTPTFVATLTTFIHVEGDIATDPTSGLLYAVDGQGLIFKINTSNGVCTTVGTVPGNLDLSAMAFDNAGNLFIWDSFGPTMYHINKTNAAVISSVTLAPSPGGQIGGLAFDPGNGQAYMAADLAAAAQFSKVDPITGAVTPVGSLSATGGIWGLAFTSDPTPTTPTSWGQFKARYR
jgi:hypothetical protein